jgi:hypothetical protein
MIRFLKSHPVVSLLFLSPGIPEYLSGSSPINAIFLNPFMFVFQIVANLGLYGPGVLLIYEAKVRWKKGWATVLLLGAAYGILEEGVALSTLYNPNAGPVGVLGTYGHWAGVNWVWSAGIVPFHALFSISLPILLLGLALPTTVGNSLLSKRKIGIVVAILSADVVALMVIVFLFSKYWMGNAILLLSFVVMGVLVFAARRVTADFLRPKTLSPSTSNRKLAVFGILFFPAVFLSQFLGQGVGLPSVVDFLLVLFVQALFLVYVIRRVGSIGNELTLLSLSAGLIAPIVVFGIIAQLGLPLVLLADGALFLFFRGLWRQHRLTPSSPFPTNEQQRFSYWRQIKER